MSANKIINFDQPLGAVREGRVYVDPAWFRYLVDVGAIVDLSTEVTGVLPPANGGTGLSSGNDGELLAFTGAATIGPVPVAALGNLLHSNPTGIPTWGKVDLTAEVSGTLPVAHGGTGVTTSTGTGAVVLNFNPSIFGGTYSSPSVNFGTANQTTLLNCLVSGPLAWSFLSNDCQLRGADKNTISVTAAATTIVPIDDAMIFLVHDRTSGGITVGVMDATGGVVSPAAFAGIAGIAFTRSAGVGLQAAVTAGANPRLLSTFAISIGAA